MGTTRLTSDENVSSDILDRLREICLRLPDAYEEQAWVGTRWMVRKKTFAHVLNIASGRPQSHATAAGTDGPVTVVTFRASGLELDALFQVGPPFFGARWGRDVVGLVFGADVDWTEVAELLTDSYCVMAPKKLADLVDRGHPHPAD